MDQALAWLVDTTKAVGQQLGAPFEQDGEYCHLTVRVSGYEANDPDAPTQRISMYFTDDAKEHVLVWLPSGTYEKSVDLAKVLRKLRDTTYARVILGEPGDDDSVALEVSYCALARGINGPRLAEIVQEITDTASEVDDIVAEASG